MSFGTVEEEVRSERAIREEAKQTASSADGVAAPGKRLFSSIGVRLAAVVLATGVLAFGLIGALTIVRLDHGLEEQANALGHLSELQLADRLKGEAQLARARIENLGDEMARRLRSIAQRPDIARALATRNDVTIREPYLAQNAQIAGFDVLIAFDENGTVVGANTEIDLISVNRLIRQMSISRPLKDILTNNRRSDPRGFDEAIKLEESFLRSFGMPLEVSIAHVGIAPVFDDFGEINGALMAFRRLARTEPTLENFSSLSNAGVVVILDGKVVSSSVSHDINFSDTAVPDRRLVRSDDGMHVAQCIEHGELALTVCTFTDASVVSATRDQMFRIGAGQTQSLMIQFLLFAAVSLVMLVCALLVTVRHSTNGLSKLSSAAMAVAGGDLQVPFRAVGVGEVRSLGIAFEKMLANLRANIGQIRQLAYFDTVTGLPNREKIRVDASALLVESKLCALFFIDLDGFKSINDTFGHKTGDQLLGVVAKRLTVFCESLLGTDSIEAFQLARVGGDEFAILLAGLASKKDATGIAGALVQELANPLEINGSHLTVGASIGVTMHPEDGKTYDELLINADLAMYAAKSGGRNRFVFFTDEIAEMSRERLRLETDLKNTLREQGLSVHYQPQISCADGSIRGVEAMVRWNHPRLGWVEPQRFVNIAEEIGLIAEIDRFVFKRALSEMEQLHDAGCDFVLAVNMSARHVEDPKFAEWIAEAVRDTRVPLTNLEIEITESTAVSDPRIIHERVADLRKLGIRFAIDDFGTGYSNLAALARLPFDTIKIDRSLISNISTNAESQNIVRIILGLANDLGSETVAEGVETYEDLQFVTNSGATMAQGFLFSRAVPLEQLSVMLQPKRIANALLRKGKEVSLVTVDGRKVS